MFKSLVCFLLLGMSACGNPSKMEYLTERLNNAEKAADTQIIPLGSPQSEQHLSSGWSKPEKYKGGRLRWIIGASASLSWDETTARSCYLHIRLVAKNSSPLEILCDNRPIWKNLVGANEQTDSISLPERIHEITF